MENLSKLFENKIWEFLKPIGYKKFGKTFVYTGYNVKTIVNIQGGKLSLKDDAYSMLNISYGRMDKVVKSINHSDFFHFRHDSFNKNGFNSIGSSYWSDYPVSINYKNESEINQGVEILREIEPLFRVNEMNELIGKYKDKMKSNCWEEIYGNLSK